MPDTETQAEPRLTDEERRRLLKGFVKKCEKLGRWPGDIRDFYKNVEARISRESKRAGTNGKASTEAMEATKERYGREILSQWDEFEKSERHPDKIAAKALHRMAAKVDPKKTSTRWKIKEWALNHLSIPPSDIDIETAPTRGAVMFLAACYETPRIKEKLFEELIRGSARDDFDKGGKQQKAESHDPNISLLDALIEATESSGTEGTGGESEISPEAPRDGAAQQVAAG